jgi:hypothetical protein
MFTDVLEESTASIFRVEESQAAGLKRMAVCSSQTILNI